MADITLPAKISAIIRLMRWHKPIGFFLVLWPTLWALWVASGGLPDPLLLVVFTLGAFIMRSAGCVINDFADRNLDGHVARTQDRPLVQGELSSWEAMIVFGVLLLIAFILVLQLNQFTILLSIGAVTLAAIYPFMKRHTYLPQVFLGAAFSWSIPMSFAAVQNNVPLEAWLLFTAVLIWTVAYDTIYAMVDREDDIKIGIKSTAILFDEADVFAILILQILVIFLLVLFANRIGLGWFFYSGLGLGALLFFYQQLLIQDRIAQKCFVAFLNNNWVGAVIFLGIALDYGINASG